jgi:septal ring factor EnvC (AmiA/AmiB activator)
MRPALTPIDPNLARPSQSEQTKTRTRAKSDSASRIFPQSQPPDDEIWNLTQRIGHLEAGLEETEQANSAIRDELNRLAGVESALQQQQQANAPLIDAYLHIMAGEERRLFHGSDDDF